MRRRHHWSKASRRRLETGVRVSAPSRGLERCRHWTAIVQRNLGLQTDWGNGEPSCRCVPVQASCGCQSRSLRQCQCSNQGSTTSTSWPRTRTLMCDCFRRLELAFSHCLNFFSLKLIKFYRSHVRKQNGYGFFLETLCRIIPQSLATDCRQSK